MTPPRNPEDLDLWLSSYLDGELDPAARLELEDWLPAHPQARERLNALRNAQASAAALRVPAEVPTGWTVRAYRIGVPGHWPAPRKLACLGLGLAQARPRALGHGIRAWRAQGRRTVRLRLR